MKYITHFNACNAIYNVKNVLILLTNVLNVLYNKVEVKKLLIVYVKKDISKIIFYNVKVVYPNVNHVIMKIHV